MAVNVEPGRSVAGYRIESHVIDAGRSCVYRATDPDLQRYVALYLATEPPGSEEAERFLAAARTLGALDDPAVLPIYASGVADGVAYAVGPEPRGRRLAERLADGTLTPAQAAALVDGLGSSLTALDAAGLRLAELDPRAVAVVDEPDGPHASVVALEADARPDGPAPDRALAALAQAISTTPALDAPTVTPTLDARPARSRRWPVALLAVVLLAAAALVVVLVTRDSVTTPPAGPGADAPAGRLAAKIPLGAEPASVGVGREGVWVGTIDGTVLHVDPRARRVVGAPISVAAQGSESMTVRTGAGAVFVATDDTLVRIDPRSERVTHRVRVGAQLTGAVVAGDSVWVARTVMPTEDRQGRGLLLRFDARTLRRVAPPAPTGLLAEDVEADGDVAWTINSLQGTVTRVGGTGAPAVVRVGVGPHAGAMVGRTLWVADLDTDSVVPVDLDTMRIAAPPVRVPRPVAVAATAGGLWVTSLESLDRDAPARLVRIDPRSRRVTGTSVPLGAGAGWVGAGHGALWVYSRAQRALLEVRPADPPPAAQHAARPSSALANGLVAPGRRIVRQPVPLTLDVPSGWLASGSPASLLLFSVSDPVAEFWILRPDLVFRPRPSSKTDTRQILAALQANRDLRVGQPRRTTFGGQPATTVTVSVERPQVLPEFCLTTCAPLFAAGEFVLTAEHGPVRLFLLDDGIVVGMSAPPDSPAWPQIDAIARSISFTQ
jgi:hypothetical protein